MYVWNDVEGVERSLNSSNCYSCWKGQKITLCTQYRYIQCYVKRVKRLCYVETKDIHIFVHNFLNIQVIFNLKKVLESWDLDLSNHTIQCYVCRRGRKSKHALTYIAIEWAKCVCPLFQHNIIFRPFWHSIECICIVYISHKHHFWPFQHE